MKDKKIRHYIQHGDMSCKQCREGFNAYWVGRS